VSDIVLNSLKQLTRLVLRTIQAGSFCYCAHINGMETEAQKGKGTFQNYTNSERQRWCVCVCVHVWLW
jgi:hypothetical protein